MKHLRLQRKQCNAEPRSLPAIIVLPYRLTNSFGYFNQGMCCYPGRPCILSIPIVVLRMPGLLPSDKEWETMTIRMQQTHRLPAFLPTATG